MIGIFGGTFDPVHFGHLRAIIEVGEIFSLDQVRLIPNKTPPHRLEPSASTSMRLEMLQLAACTLSNVVIDTRELDRDGASYMIDTLSSLRSDFPEQPLLLFVGSDAFNGLTTWHRWCELFDYAHVVVMTRPGSPVQWENDFWDARQVFEAGQLARYKAGKLFFQPITQLDISASAIRKMIAEKRDPRFLLPDTVLDYIQSHHLYQNA
ncbi:nicotinate-nucleotide adenylyltransferase [Candidatus Methylomicrobium oryzae]|jgi:nicotinate-nucleotide adenylyltransferase|uniref:nicotinate-nucleotide adenylyltransferase n=1 Tax=Candidatus Methylomicrobium oryzae TaxID=2802053 RepID=UPI00192475D8|nr:nicotinate-nucleotide adenylyltransferase [Methylomicrobium sp. RS1]MBL1264347.1 nicotinate-nucleotide adenylyltransferase [Methylomicrobium sp. RS1]